MATYSTGTDSGFELMSFGIPSQNTLQYFQSTLRDPMQATTEIGRQLAEQSQRAFEFYSGHDAINAARAAIRQIDHMFMPDDIREYQTVDQFQQAQYQMREYIMADPYIRDLYHRGQIEGYADYYVDTSPGDVGFTHLPYRKMVDGMVQIDDETDEHKIQVFMFGDSPAEEVPFIGERIDLMNTMSQARMLLRQRIEDITSPTNARLD